MRRTIGECVAVAVCLLVPLASPGIAISQERTKLVDTGVIFSAQQVERYEKKRWIRVAPPFWTPTEEEVTRLEGKLKPYLQGVKTPQAKAIAADLESYKRQYIGYSDGGRKWILVNGFCEMYWGRENNSWRDRIVIVNDGGTCFFEVRYELSGSQFEQLEINGDA